MLQLSQEYFIEAAESVHMQVRFPSLQVHGKNQSGKAQIMVSVQVTDKDVTDLVDADVVLHHLHLCTFTAIDKKVVILYGQVLAGWESSVGWQRSTGAEDG